MYENRTWECKDMAPAGFEPTSSERKSDVLTIRRWSQGPFGI